MDKKKVRRRKRILGAAAELFQDVGFDDTTINDIAGKADVGVGTIYNYFSSKNEILLNIVADICIEKKPEAIIHENDPVHTIVDYLNGYFDEFSVFAKEIWCSWFASLFKERHLFEKAFELDLKIIGELAVICERLQAMGMVTRDVPAKEIAQLFYTPFISWMMSYIMLPEMGLETAKAEFERQLNLMFAGMMPAGKRDG